MIITQVIVMVLLPRWRLHPLHKLLMILCPGILQGLLQRVGQRVDVQIGAGATPKEEKQMQPVPIYRAHCWCVSTEAPMIMFPHL